MSLLKSLTLVCLLTFALGFIGCQDKGGGGTPTPTPTVTPPPKPTPAEAAECKPPDKPCDGSGPLVSHAYSECCEDGYWHVVQFDLYKCPELKWLRVAFDAQTHQRCKEGAGQVAGAPPSPVGSGYKDFHGDSSCQSPTDTKRKITISVCENGVWVNKIYRLYECLNDKSLRITEPPDALTKTEIKCTDPPPRPAAP